MTRLVFTYTDDLDRLDEATAVHHAAKALGYDLDTRHAHAVVAAWRDAHGKRVFTDDGPELSVPPMPTGPALVAFLLSVCHTVP